MRSGLIVAASLIVTGCQAEPEVAPVALTPEQSSQLAPSDARLAELYSRSCKSCHTSADTGAPLAGDRTQWDPRWAKGEDALLASTLQGLNGMPAGGQCFACTPEDYSALITFMAGRE